MNGNRATVNYPFIMHGSNVEATLVTANQMMHAAVVLGIAQTPRYEEFPCPVPAEEAEVLTVTAPALKPSDRWMVAGLHYAPATFPHVVGLDGVGHLPNGTRVAFMIPQPPYGGMAERTLVRRGAWLPVPDGIDDVTAAAVMNPGMAAWKTVSWEGELRRGQTVLIVGATGASGRVATQLALGTGARGDCRRTQSAGTGRASSARSPRHNSR
jgi:NADPH:quinone reductase-like Zn-dependent oxidoreductase